MYYNGEGTPKDMEKALYWYEKAAEQGHINAQFYCGWMNDNGEGTPQDKSKALQWYEKSAEQGNATAQFNCGNMYDNGIGTEKDTVKALYWYEKSAAQGDADAEARAENYYLTHGAKAKEFAYFQEAAYMAMKWLNLSLLKCFVMAAARTRIKKSTVIGLKKPPSKVLPPPNLTTDVYMTKAMTLSAEKKHCIGLKKPPSRVMPPLNLTAD